MSTVETLTLFGVFGAMCAYYVSVLGFALTAASLVILLGLIGAAGFPLFGVWLLAGAFVAMQVGYFGGVVGRALTRHVRRLAAKDPRRIDGERRINQE